MSEPITVKAKISGPCRYDCTKVLVTATGRIMNDNVHIRVDNSIAKQFVARVNADTPTYSPQDVEELIQWYYSERLQSEGDVILAKLKGGPDWPVDHDLKGGCQHTYQVPLNRDDPDLGPCASCGELPSTKDKAKGGVV